MDKQTIKDVHSFYERSMGLYGRWSVPVVVLASAARPRLKTRCGPADLTGDSGTTECLTVSCSVPSLDMERLAEG